MSDRRRANGPSPNGQKYIDSIDPDDPEYVKELLRPVEVKQDVKQMEERKRVNIILKSKAFRDELEQIVVEQLKSGPTPASVLALQQISEMFLPQARLKHGAIFGQGNSAVVPICNISNEEAAAYDRGEKLIRCKLASSYRLVEMLGWSRGTSGYITARVSPDNDTLLVAPHGLLYNEVTASSLVKVNGQGEVIYQGSTNFAVDRTALRLHFAIHSARPDLKCVIHIRSPSALAVSGMNYGLLPLCHDAMVLGDIGSFEYGGGELDNEQLDNLYQTLGPAGKVLLLRNGGVIVGGESVEECFQLSRNVMNAIDTQLRAIPLGLDNIYLPSEEARRRSFELGNKPPSGDRKWRRGEMEFEAMMRHLDNAGYRTGYLFREPLLRKVEKHDRVNAEVEVPPTATSFVYNESDKERFQNKPMKTEWLNSPMAYKKEETEEAAGGGAAAPKSRKVTRWVPDEAPGTMIKIDNPNQFVPVGTNPKEVKAKVKEIRKEYYDEKITAGPQSRILEGMTWEEAQRIREGNVASDTIILVGAASRGIIQRDHQNSATVFKTYYAPNPFDNVTEEDVEEYKAEIQKKTRKTTTGEVLTTEDESDAVIPGPDGRLISTEERMQHIRMVQTESPVPEPSPVPVLSLKVNKGTLETDVDAVDVMAGGEPQPAPPHKTQAPLKPQRAQPEPAIVSSPAKSTSSGEATVEEPSGTDGGSPVKAASKKPESSTPTPATEEKEKKKKKKGGFRMPSFSSKKKEK